MKRCFALLFVLASTLSSVALAADTNASSGILGRWDFVCESADGRTFPSWLEVKKSGHSTLVGAFVGEFGSARPIAKIKQEKDHFWFTIPPQWEQRTDDLEFEFVLANDALTGKTTDADGKVVRLSGKRAPSLKRDYAPKWSEPVDLFNGENLDGWETQLDGVENGWVVRDGFLYNQKPGQNLMTTQKFDDFKLHAEFRYPNGSNSGLYLRGRYEVQIEDGFGREAESHQIGGVYGHLTPSINAAKPAGYWQTYDITLVGRTITVELNGERVIDRQAIPGITGGAIDSDEAAPGPILIQGDHGPVEFRRLTITPAKRNTPTPADQ